MEPSPKALKFVPAVLLPEFGWEHQEAGKKNIRKMKKVLDRQ